MGPKSLLSSPSHFWRLLGRCRKYCLGRKVGFEINSLIHYFTINSAIEDSVSNGGFIFNPQGILAVSGDIFHCQNWRGGTIRNLHASETQWVKARDVAKHLITYRTVLTTRKYPAQNSNGEEPWLSVKITVNTGYKS